MVLLSCAPHHLPQACSQLFCCSVNNHVHCTQQTSLYAQHMKSWYSQGQAQESLESRSSFQGVRKVRTYLKNCNLFWYSIMLKKIKSLQKLNVLAHLRSTAGRISQVANQSCTEVHLFRSQENNTAQHTICLPHKLHASGKKKKEAVKIKGAF